MISENTAYTRKLLSDLLSGLDPENLEVARRIAAMPEEPPPEPQNFVRNNRTGATYDLGPSMPAGRGLDMGSAPVEIAGVGKGYRMKGDPFTVVMPDGTIVRLGEDTGATRTRRREDLAIAQAEQNLENSRTRTDQIVLNMMKQMGVLPGMGGGMPPGLKLKPGEQWNPEHGRVDAVPGSEIYNKQSAKHAESVSGLSTINSRMAEAETLLQGLLSEKNRSGFEGNFGGYNAYLSQFLPYANDTRASLEKLRSMMKGMGLERMRAGGSIGAMTEKEWPIVERIVENLTPYMSEDAARDAMGRILELTKSMRTNAQEVYDTQWGGTQFHGQRGQPAAGGQSPAGPAVPVRDPAQALQLPPGTRFVLPDGRTGTAR